MELSRILQKIRKELGFSSARAFYHGHLAKHEELDFNYSYYVKIERGEVTPSPALAMRISSCFTDEAANQVLLALCRDLFPKKRFLFESGSASLADPREKERPARRTRQRFLTPAQVAAITRSKQHYYLYLLAVLARKPLADQALRESLRGAELGRLLADFEKARLLSRVGEGIRLVSTEMRFPEPSTPELRAAYADMDRWDQAFQADFGLEKVVDKMLIRRSSLRHLAVIRSFADSLTDLVRISDETHASLNNEVVLFRISIHQGRIEG
jgi:hypothetical protein